MKAITFKNECMEFETPKESGKIKKAKVTNPCLWTTLGENPFEDSLPIDGSSKWVIFQVEELQEREAKDLIGLFENSRIISMYDEGSKHIKSVKNANLERGRTFLKCYWYECKIYNLDKEQHESVLEMYMF
jgi:hypothetical protein